MKMIASRRPKAEEFDSDYHADLIQRIEGECAIEVLHRQMTWICELACSISTEQVDRIDAPFRWSIRQVFEHCANSERLFGYRIMAIADGSEPTLPGWDENISADSRFGLGNFTALASELGDLRKSNLALLRRLSPKTWDCRGIADGHRVTLRSLSWVMAGHLQHHFEIVEKRCGVTATGRPTMTSE